MKRTTGLIIVLAAATLGAALAWGSFAYAFLPPPSQPAPSPEWELGRRAFYTETFGNELFFTDIMGILDGPLSLPSFALAILRARGEGTDNLMVRVSRTVTVGGRTFRRGERVATGLDLPKGAWAPVGLPLSYRGGRIRAGITCAVCHAAVSPDGRRVLEGVPNTNLNAGLLLAFATNSAAYFPHAGVGGVCGVGGQGESVAGHGGAGSLAGFVRPGAVLPDPDQLEQAVDADFLRWPPGSFDTATDLMANPVQITDLFTLGEHPYGSTGFAAGGPFSGLNAFNHNFTRDADPLTQVTESQPVWQIHPEVYLGTILQRAASERFRYDRRTGLSPSAFFARRDPTPGAPGLIQVTLPPAFPAPTPQAPGRLFIGPPGRPAAEQAGALSVFQNSLRPPPGPPPSPTAVQGRAVFQVAGCATCHAGPNRTNHRVIPAPQIGTEPSRAAHDTGGYKVPGLAGLAWTPPYLHDGGVAVGPPPERRPGVAATLMQGTQPDPAASLRALVDRAERERVVAANRADAALRAMRVDGGGHPYWVDQAAGFSEAEQAALIDYLLTGDSLHWRRGAPNDGPRK